MKKTWIFRAFAVLLAVSMLLVGCTPQTTENGKDEYVDYQVDKKPGDSQFGYDGNYAAPELTIDGKDDDAQWASAKTLATFGNGGAASIQVYRGENALFFFVKVADPILLTEGDTNDDAVTRSDSVEIYIDSLADGGSKPQNDDYQINLGIHGKTRIMQGSGSGWGGWNGLIDYEVSLNGTLNDSTEASDVGYSVEIMIPYAQIGIEKDDTIGVSFGQVDKFGAGASAGTDWNWFGWTYNGVLCEPQTPNNYILLDGENNLMARDEVQKPDADMAGYVLDYQTQQPVAGVSVSVEGSDLTAVTDDQGYFVFEKVSSNSSYTLNFAKEGYFGNSVVYSRQELRDSNGGRVLKNVELRNQDTAVKTTITGTVKNVVDGTIEGALVLVEGTDLSAITGADGSFSIAGVPVDGTVNLIVSKIGYGESKSMVDSSLLVENAISELGDINLNLPYAVTENFGLKSDSFADSVLQISRGLTGVEMLLTGSRQLHGHIEIYVDTKECADHRDNDANMWCFNLNDDGTISVNNYAAEGAGSAMGLTYILHKNDSTGYSATFLIPYSYLGIEPLEVFGISLGQWSTTANDWDGWGFAGQFVAPETPETLIRLSAINELYRQNNNTAMVNLSGNAGMGGVRVEAAGLSTTTGSDGAWNLKIPATAEAITITYSRQGYETKVTTIPADYFGSHYAFTENVNMQEQSVTISGTVTDDTTGAVLSGVTVTIMGTDISGVTGADGKYTIANVSTENDIVLRFDVDGYAIKEESMTAAQLAAAAEHTLNVQLTAGANINYVTLNGSVTNVNGPVADATVSVVGNSALTITTGKDGSFVIANFPAVDCVIRIEKDGYIVKEINMKADDVERTATEHSLGQIDLWLNYAKLYGIIADKSDAFAAFQGYVTRSATGIEFKFVGSRPFVGNLELFVDTKTSAGDNARDLSDYLFMLQSGGGLSIVNWGEGAKNEAIPANMVYTVEGADTNQPILYFTLPYDFFGQVDPAASITSTEVIGISAGQWHTGVSDWDGWDCFALYGANGSAFVKPEMPLDYIRIGAKNEIYNHINNETLNLSDYEINFGTSYEVGGDGVGMHYVAEADNFYATVVSRDESGVTFKFLTTGDFGKEGEQNEMVLVYFDKGESTGGWTPDYLVKIASDGTVYGKAGAWWSATEADKIGEVVITRENGVTTFEWKVSYDLIGISSTEVFGIAMRECSHNAVDHHLYDPWFDCYFNRGTDIGASATGIDAADCAQFIRVDADGNLYAAANNEAKGVILTGTVTNVNGPVAGATVTLVDSGKTAVTGEDGSFRFVNVTTSNCVIRIEKDGYISKELSVVSGDVGEIDLWLNYAKLYGIIADKSDAFAAFQGYVTRSATGIEFKFVGSRPFVGNLELFVDTKTSAGDNARDLSDYLFMLKCDGGLQIVNWGEGTKNEAIPANMIYTVEGADTNQPILYFTLPYDFFGQVDPEASITSTEVIGISAGQWHTGVSDWDGWDCFALYGANGSAFVKPEMPLDYIRIGAKNEIYNHINNETLNLSDYEINFGTGYNAENNPVGARPVEVADNFYATVVSRDESGVTFKFLTTGDFGKEGEQNEMVLVYFDKGESTGGWTPDYLVKIASDGTVYGRANNAWWSVTEADKIGEVVITRENGVTTFEWKVSYDLIGISSTEVFGIAMRECSHNDIDHHLYDPWWDCYFNRGTDIGAPTTGIDAADCAQFIRVDADGKLYAANSNEA